MGLTAVERLPAVLILSRRCRLSCERSSTSAGFGARLVAIVVLALAAFAFRNLLFGPTVDAYEVRKGDLTQTVVATGRVTTPQRVSIGALVTERVARIPVQEGQEVRRGDVLLVLDDKDERAALAQAEAAVAQAEAKLRQMREVALPVAQQALAQAEANRVLALQQYQRNQDLAAKNFIAKSALDDTKRNVDVAESQQSCGAARGRVESSGRWRLPHGRDRARAGAGDAARGAGAARGHGGARAGRTACSSPATSSRATWSSRDAS